MILAYFNLCKQLLVILIIFEDNSIKIKKILSYITHKLHNFNFILRKQKDVCNDFRPMITYKYWVAQTTPTSSLSTDIKVHTNCQTMINCTKSTEIISKYNQAKINHNFHHNQLYEHIEEKKSGISDDLRNDRAFVSDDHSFMSGDFKGSSVTKDYKYNSPCMTRDAQIQTSNRKNLLRRKTRKRSKSVTEKISCRKRYNNEPRIVTDFHTVRSRSSSRRNYCDEPWLRVRVLENKRAEYINKFTAVNRQIEEITATLRETCCDDKNSGNNLENCDEYFSSISDDAKISTINWSDVESRSTIVKRKNISREKNSLVNVKKITEELKQSNRKNVQEILHINNLNNNETISSPKETRLASSRNPKKILNDVFGHDSVRTIKKTVCSANKISRNKTRAKCRIKQMSFNLDLAKNQNEPQECSIENKSFDKLCLTKTNFTILSNEHARNLAEGLANLEESRYCKIIEEKIGEVAILEDIKKRIDRDFDDLPAERSDTEDFLTQKSSNLDRQCIMDVTLAKTIEKSEFKPLIIPNLDESTETEIHNSMSTGAISEYSNKNSALSKYFSCTRIPSLISLTKNEDELATVDRSIIIHDSHSNLHSNYHYYDSCSNLSLNNRSFSNSSFDHSCSNLEYIARYDSSAQYISPNKFLIGTANELYDMFEMSEGQENFTKDKIREWEHPLFGESKRDKKEWQGEKRYTANSTSKSSKYIGSIDSGVFSSSLVDLHPAESSFHIGETKFKKNRRTGKLDKSSAAVDSGSDSSCTDDTLDQKVNDVVKDLTKNLILCERKARMKLKARDARYVRIRGLIKILNLYHKGLKNRFSIV